MSDIVEEYKTFWRSLKLIMATQPIKGFLIEFSGSGDEGQIDEVGLIVSGRRTKTSKKEKGMKDDFGHDEIPPHPWNHQNEVILDEEAIEKLVVPNVKVQKETFVEGQGWVKQEVVKDISLLDHVKELAYKLMEAWYDEWEVNEGSRGTIYLYRKEAEYEFIKYFEDYDELQRGVRYYSKKIELEDFEAVEYDNYDARGLYVDEELEPLDEEDDD
jgi:hypothetical protein